jgi:hypothetical protein
MLQGTSPYREATIISSSNVALRKVDQKYLESFEMWCWRRMEKISWTDRVRNEEVLHKARRRGIYYIQ